MASEVDREVVDAVMERVRQWDADGLALEDQLMASYGPAMEVYGRYSRVINPDGSDAESGTISHDCSPGSTRRDAAACR